MLVSIKAELDSNQPWYTNHDAVQGKVVLQIKSSTEVTRVRVGLYGLCMTHLTRVDDIGQKFTDQVEEASGVLHLESQLFPPPGEQFASSYSLKADSYTWPFKFMVPLKTNGIKKDYLPPSLSDVDPDTAYIRYYIEAEVEFSGSVLRNKTSTHQRLPITILPTDPEDLLDAVTTYGVIHAKTSRVVSSTKTMSGLFSRLVSTLSHDMAPTCSSVATFTVRSELLLTPGQKFSWNLEAVELTDEKIEVTGIKVTLEATTRIRAKNLNKDVDQTRVLLDKQQLKLKAGDLTAQLDKSVVILPDPVPPTFKAPNISREYFLQIRINWAHRKTSNLQHKALLRRRVWVRSGMQVLPNYENGDVIRPDRKYPMEKWYTRF